MTKACFTRMAGVAVLAALLTAGCSGNMIVTDDRPDAQGAASILVLPPVPMAGQWRLVAASGRACAMTFTATGAEGTIAPQGGCPANFFTSRRWVYQDGSLIIQDHTSKPLVKMKQAGGERFEGELPNGEVVRLER